jgi:hypothetical protein
LIRTGLETGKVALLQESPREGARGRFEIAEQPILDLFQDLAGVDAVSIDDRLLNAMANLQDVNGRTVAVLSSLDLVTMLRDRGRISAQRHLDIVHRLREGMFGFIPLTTADLTHYLLSAKPGDDGRLAESTELRVIREYIARLHSSDFLCTPADLVFMDELWRVSVESLAAVWSVESATPEQCAARADWVISHVAPDIELALRFSGAGRDQMAKIAQARLMALAAPRVLRDDLREAYAQWLEAAVVAGYLPGASEVIAAVANDIGAVAVRRSKEIAGELSSRGFVASAANSPDEPNEGDTQQQ